MLINVQHGLRQIEFLANSGLVGEDDLNGGRRHGIVDDNCTRACSTECGSRARAWGASSVSGAEYELERGEHGTSKGAISNGVRVQ